MKPFVLPLSDSRADLETVGGKGMSLARLVNAGLPVPDGFHVTTEAYRCFVAENKLQPKILAALRDVDPAQPATLEAASASIAHLFINAPIPAEIADAISNAYTELGTHQSTITNQKSTLPVAVRSSATAEDLPEASFAGQQETYLNIMGVDHVLDATRKCWASLWTARAIAYRIRQDIPPGNVALAVVIQLLVDAEAAGIMFTANPLTGKRSEAVINAAWGLGEAVVGGAVTPDTITVDKSTRRVLHRETAEKKVMTVRAGFGTQEQPVSDFLKNKVVLDDAQAAELARLGAQIESLYGMPMDIEWAWIPPSPAGRGAALSLSKGTRGEGDFTILQARPVTALPEEPIEWKAPHPKGIYMRGSVVDLMPDPLSPLFATLGASSLVQQMYPLGKRLTRVEPALTDDYFTTINGYAYMNAYMPPKTWGWALVGLIPSYPRILRQVVPLWRDEMYPEYQVFTHGLQGMVSEDMSTEDLWRTSQDIVAAAARYVCALMFATMGASAGAEMLLTRVYEKMARREGDPPATALLMGWDNIPVQAEKSLYDLAMWARERDGLVKYLQGTGSETIAVELQSDAPPSGVQPEDWQGLRERFNRHLDRFGHIIFQLDFAADLPLDCPEPMLENIKMYLRGEGVNPHERQQASQQKRIQTGEAVLARLKGFRRWAFRTALRIGQTMAEIREDALAGIGLAYPKLRLMLRELGRRFVEAGFISAADDIFWLEKDEIDTLVLRGESPPQSGSHMQDRVMERKAYHQRLEAETPPPMIPVKERILGIKTDVFVAHGADAHTENTIKGVAASPGIVTAPACILHGPADFDRMRPGDVLVAGTTTPAWTPLFAMASAVVTDIGGPLSHGSIVAREYGIPAVMGTGVATRRICPGQKVTVDGGAGTVTFEQKASQFE